MVARTASPRAQHTKEPSSPSPSCPPLIRCAMICGALGLLGTAGWLMYLGWMFAVFLFTPYFLLHISLITLFWWLSITLIIEGIAIIRTYAGRGNQRYREEGFWLALALLFPLLIAGEAVYNANSCVFVEPTVVFLRHYSNYSECCVYVVFDGILSTNTQQSCAKKTSRFLDVPH